MANEGQKLFIKEGQKIFHTFVQMCKFTSKNNISKHFAHYFP